MSSSMPNPKQQNQAWLSPFVGGAGVLAILSASCCILPIGLSILGLGGTWLSILGPFVAYRLPILIIVGAVLMLTWWRVLRPGGNRPSAGVLGLYVFATLAFILAATTPLWERDAQQALWQVWLESRR